MVDKKMDESISQFCAVTGASSKEAKRFLEKYKKLEVAVDAFYNDPSAMAAATRRNNEGPSTSKLSQLFDKYKDPDGDEISANGTIKFCEDLDVDPENVVLLAVAYELKSERLGEWNRKGWIEGWKNLGCDSIPAMKTSLVKLGDKLGSNPEYFRKVYQHTFDFARAEGQRSLALDVAQAFWSLLLPVGLKGGALSHISSRDGDNDISMNGEQGWKDEYTDWWFEYLTERGGKGVSKDTWAMFLDFVRTIDAKFEKYDMEEAWPSTIDDFVTWAKERLASSGA
ncbi:Scaffold-type E3 ligase [Stygiomarasmius scandens]|uniref:Defective in cullin neddylation protein n=1 Tax=Marasmiellus scandens TaxID=2682957 RepID=A0ABR1J5R0_9AGAR